MQTNWNEVIATTKAELDAIAACYLAMPDRKLNAALAANADYVLDRMGEDAQRMGSERAAAIRAGAVPRKDSAFSPALPAPGCQ